MSDEYEFSEEPPWREDENPADDYAGDNIRELISKCSVKVTKIQLGVPFSHDPSNQYIGGEIYLDSSNYWQIDGGPSTTVNLKFKTSEEAVLNLVEAIELDRHRMINEEFNKEIR